MKNKEILRKVEANEGLTVEEIILYHIILHEGVEMDEQAVQEFCRGKIARHKIPKYIFFVKEFPMTGSGKIQKFKLKDLSLKLLAEKGIQPI